MGGLRFTLREVTLLLTIVGVGLGWFVNRQSLLQALDEAKVEVIEHVEVVAMAWAKDKGGRVTATGRGIEVEATPDGRVTISRERVFDD